MKPAPFAYVRAGSLDQTFDLLARYGDEARVLAGGQNLIPTPNLCLSTPALLIDINDLKEFAGSAVEKRRAGIRVKNRTTRLEVTGSRTGCTGR